MPPLPRQRRAVAGTPLETWTGESFDSIPTECVLVVFAGWPKSLARTVSIPPSVGYRWRPSFWSYRQPTVWRDERRDAPRAVR